VNTKATEVLYQTVGQLAELDMDTTLVDVCCGLGTIGLCLAKEVKQVSRLLQEIVPLLSENSPRITSSFFEWKVF
jgi:tRNA (uracil-5-)-methyltransferase